MTGARLTVLAALAVALPAHANVREWSFRVLLDDTPIGQHRFVLHERGAEMELTSTARFDVRVLGFSAYRYVHEASESWRGGCLASLTARTDDNGEHAEVRASRGAERLTVSGPRSPGALRGCVLTFAYWNPEILRAKELLNAQTGEYEKVVVSRLREEPIVVRGQSVSATRFRISGPKNPIDLWYSPQSEWLALESTVSGGRRLRYQLQ